MSMLGIVGADQTLREEGCRNAIKTQAMIQHTPPIGVIAPSHDVFVSTSTYKLPEKSTMPATNSQKLHRQAALRLTGNAIIPNNTIACARW